MAFYSMLNRGMDMYLLSGKEINKECEIIEKLTKEIIVLKNVYPQIRERAVK